MSDPAPVSYRAVPRGVWVLGFVSLLMDVSSETIHALLPVYMVSVMGASMALVGLVEGIAEATASIVKVFSGVLSDRIGRRKRLAAAGYGLAALVKPIFPLAPDVGWLVAARFLDRVGKGIRGAPRDALVADLSPPDLRGAAFGLRQTLDTIGAFLGPLLAIGLMAASADDYRLVFWVAVVPAVLSFALIAFAVDEPERPAGADGRAAVPLGPSLVARLGGPFWVVVGLAGLFTLARFSEAFLVLKAQAAGLPVALVPAVLVIMNVVYAAAAYPAGALSDRVGRIGLVVAGFAVLVAADLILALADGLAWVLAGVALWGLHMGLTQGLFAALVADAAPPALRGTAFGVFNLVSGVALLAASVAAGALWDASGARATFLAGAALTALALAGLGLARRHLPGAAGPPADRGCR